MNNNTAITFLALFGFIAAVGAVAIVVASRGIGNQSAQSSQPVYSLPIHGEAIETQAPLAHPVLYENEERWELRRGPDRLIEEIIVHRKVTQNG